MNKGPRSKELLDYIIALQSNFSVFPLYGNHDKILHDFLKYKHQDAAAMLQDLNSGAFLNLTGEEEQTYLHFLSSLPYYFISGDFILVHAGFNFSTELPFEGTFDMLNIRDFSYDHIKANGRTIVHGHRPVPSWEIEERIRSVHKYHVIPLDNGCALMGEKEGMGNLLCLNLDSMELISERCSDL